MGVVAEESDIIIMKNFNRRSSHGYRGSKRRELAQHAHSRGSRAFTHTLYINTVTTTQCEAPAQLLYFSMHAGSFRVSVIHRTLT